MQDLSKWTVMPGITRRVSISSFQCSRTFLNIPISGSQGVVSVWWMNLITQSELQGCQSQVSDWSRPGGARLSLAGTSKGSDLSQSDLTHLGIVSPLSPILNVSQLSFFLPFCLFLIFNVESTRLQLKCAIGSESHYPPSILTPPRSLRIIHPTNSRLMRQLAFTPTNVRHTELKGRKGNLNIKSTLWEWVVVIVVWKYQDYPLFAVPNSNFLPWLISPG